MGAGGETRLDGGRQPRPRRLAQQTAKVWIARANVGARGAGRLRLAGP